MKRKPTWWNEFFWLVPLQMVVVALLVCAVFWGFLILLFAVEVH